MEFGDFFFNQFGSQFFIIVQNMNVYELEQKFYLHNIQSINWENGLRHLHQEKESLIIISPLVKEWRFIFSSQFKTFEDCLKIGLLLSRKKIISYIVRSDSHSDFDKWAKCSNQELLYIVTRKGEEFQINGKLDENEELNLKEADYYNWDLFSHFETIIGIDILSLKKNKTHNELGFIGEASFKTLKDTIDLNQLKTYFIKLEFPYPNNIEDDKEFLEKDEFPF